MTSCMRCATEEPMPGASWETCPHGPNTCFVNGCVESGVHLVDFTAAGEGWLPMCDEHKEQDDALMALMKDPKKAKLVEEMVTDIENKRHQ